MAHEAIEACDFHHLEPPRPYGCQYARAYFPSYQNENQRRAEKAALLEFYNLCGGMKIKERLLLEDFRRLLAEPRQLEPSSGP